MSFAGFSEADMGYQSPKRASFTPKKARLPPMRPPSQLTEAAHLPPLPEEAKLAPVKEPEAHNGPDLVQDVDEAKVEAVAEAAQPIPDPRSKLDIMREKQKEMEESNQRKKAILARAIAERTLKTCEESEKLRKAQEELGQIDKVLSTDVRVIRDEIEMASIAFMESQKRYEKAEREFVESKMQLHDRSERKETLTEHLITVIQQTELRKSTKLEEIMKILDIAPSESG